MTDKPQFKIHGQKRREYKKQYFELSSFVKNFWYYHNLDKDMAIITGIESKDGYPMNDDDAMKKFEMANNKLKKMKLKLDEPYDL